jgi:integrase
MKVRKVTYTEKIGNGHKQKKQTAKFYGVFMDFGGVLRRLPLFADRRASDAMARIVDRLNSLRSSNDTLPPDLARAVDEMPAAILASLAKWDIIRPEKAATSKPLVDHVGDWRAALLARGGTEHYAGVSASRVRRIVENLGLATVGDVSASRVETFLASLRQDRKDAKGKIHRGIGRVTANYFLRDARSFFKWMVDDRRAFENPLGHLKGDKKAKIEKRRERRALSPDELRWLLEVTECGYTIVGQHGDPSEVIKAVELYGMSGADRAMLYRLAVETGLRSAELRSLTRSSFQLGENPRVTIAAAYAKNRRLDTLPLKPVTAAMLTKHLAGKMPTARAFVMPKSDRIIDMMKADLAAARAAWVADTGSHQEREQTESETFLAYCDDAGHYADFHALRHTFISNLAAGGVHPKTAQTLARHSTITLTMDHYTHMRREDLAGALDTLPDLSSVPKTAMATGTDGGGISLSASLSPRVLPQCTLADSSGLQTEKVAKSENAIKTAESTGFSGNGLYRSRTDTPLRALDFESNASANSAKRPLFKFDARFYLNRFQFAMAVPRLAAALVRRARFSIKQQRFPRQQRPNPLPCGLPRRIGQQFKLLHAFGKIIVAPNQCWIPESRMNDPFNHAGCRQMVEKPLPLNRYLQTVRLQHPDKIIVAPDVMSGKLLGRSLTDHSGRQTFETPSADFSQNPRRFDGCPRYRRQKPAADHPDERLANRRKLMGMMVAIHVRWRTPHYFSEHFSLCDDLLRNGRSVQFAQKGFHPELAVGMELTVSGYKTRRTRCGQRFMPAMREYEVQPNIKVWRVLKQGNRCLQMFPGDSHQARRRHRAFQMGFDNSFAGSAANPEIIGGDHHGQRNFGGSHALSHNQNLKR